jgi:hypothetical protein
MTDPTPPTLPDSRPQLSMMTVLGIITLVGAATIYGSYGVTAYPRQEWIIEVLASIIFVIPVINLLRVPGSLATGVRILGGMLVLHSVWDAFHWPGASFIHTPIDPWIPQSCPFIDLPIGTWLLVRGR